MVVPIFRAAICPPISSAGSKNQNIFISRNNSWLSPIFIPIKQAAKNYPSAHATSIGLMRIVRRSTLPIVVSFLCVTKSAIGSAWTSIYV